MFDALKERRGPRKRGKRNTEPKRKQQVLCRNELKGHQK